jgi:hypothetical protein
MKDQVFKRLSKKSKRGMRGWPIATIAYYGPDASRATKVVVSIIPTEDELEPNCPPTAGHLPAISHPRRIERLPDRAQRVRPE